MTSRASAVEKHIESNIVNDKSVDDAHEIPGMDELKALMEEDTLKAEEKTVKEESNDPKKEEISEKEAFIDDFAILKDPDEGDKQKEEQQFSELEKKAMEKGWRPKDQFKDDPENWRSAREFLDRGELLDTISSLGKTNKNLKTTVEALAKRFKKIDESNAKKNREDLLNKKRSAIEAGDVEGVNDIDTKIYELQQSQAEFNQPAAQDNNPVLQEPEMQDFIARNSGWLNATTAETKAMKSYALEKSQELENLYKGTLSTQDLVNQVEKSVKTMFPTYFSKIDASQQTQPAAPKHPTVERSRPDRSPNSNKSKVTFADLPREAKIAIRQMHALNPNMALQDWVDAWRRDGLI